MADNIEKNIADRAAEFVETAANREDQRRELVARLTAERERMGKLLADLGAVAPPLKKAGRPKGSRNRKAKAPDAA